MVMPFMEINAEDVRRMRDAGMTWPMIGDALYTTRQTLYDWRNRTGYHDSYTRADLFTMRIAAAWGKPIEDLVRDLSGKYSTEEAAAIVGVSVTWWRRQRRELGIKADLPWYTRQREAA